MTFLILPPTPFETLVIAISEIERIDQVLSVFFAMYLLKFKIDLNESFSRGPFYGGGKVTVGKDRVYVNQMRTAHRVVAVVEVLRLSTRNDVKQTQLETTLN